MNTNNIKINTHSSIKLNIDKVIYFDPFEIKDETNDADIIFITHSHFDHLDFNSINKIKKENTIVVAPKSIEEEISKIEFEKYIYLEPFDEVTLDNINIKTIPLYNNEKQFHPRENNWLGYILTIDGLTYYIAGDTDVTEENKKVKCDIAFIPIGGKFTMNVEEATELIKEINSKVVIPIHYGTVVGEPTYGKELKEKLKDINIKVIEKI